MKVKLKDLPTQELPDVLRYAATLAKSAGIKNYAVRITKTELILETKNVDND